MKINKGNNRGISLVELLVALAILAMLMTAVIMMMSNNTVVYRKTKADINVQTTAQETYNALQDSIMQAKVIEITGYETNPADLVTYKKASLILDSDSNTFGFEKLKIVDSVGNATYKSIHPTRISIKYSVEESDAKDNKNCTVNYYFCRYLENDVRKCNVYVSRTYDFAGKIDDVWAAPATEGAWTPASTSEPSQEDRKAYADYLFTSSLQEVTLTVDYEKQSIDMKLNFYDKNMVYNTSGIVSIRNSYVMKEMRDRTAIDITVTETTTGGGSSGSGTGTGGSTGTGD